MMKYVSMRRDIKRDQTDQQQQSADEEQFWFQEGHEGNDLRVHTYCTIQSLLNKVNLSMRGTIFLVIHGQFLLFQVKK